MKPKSFNFLALGWFTFGAVSTFAGIYTSVVTPEGIDELAWVLGVVANSTLLTAWSFFVGLSLLTERRFSRRFSFAVWGSTLLISFVMIGLGFGIGSPRLMAWGLATLFMTLVSFKALMDLAKYGKPFGTQVEQMTAANARIFISYRRDDSAEVTGRIYEHLTAHFPEDQVFRDIHSIPLGDDFRHRLDAAIAQCDVLLAVIGSQWLNAKDQQGRRRLDVPTDFVRLEIEAALQRKIPVIPLIVHRATMPQAEELPATMGDLAFRNGLPVRPDPDFRNDMNRLISAISTLGAPGH